MKTAIDIRADFPGTKTTTRGKGNVYVCRVTFPDGEYIEGLSQTLEGAEDTAWYGTKITMRDRIEA